MDVFIPGEVFGDANSWVGMFVSSFYYVISQCVIKMFTVRASQFDRQSAES